MSINWRLPGDKRVLARRDMTARRMPAPEACASADVVVGVAMRNQGEHLGRCLQSICGQTVGDLRVLVVLLDDGSTDDWTTAAGELLELPNLLILSANCGSAARARNAILDYVDEHLPSVRWVARLDADDAFAERNSLAAAVACGDSANAKYVLGGNRLLQDGRLRPAANAVTPALGDHHYVEALLAAMADGTASNELPSCNLLLRTGTGWRYPDASSAEDHWLVANLLINHFAEGALVMTPLYCNYTLGGTASRENARTGAHRKARQGLLQAAQNWIHCHSQPGAVLGWGREGVARLVDGQVCKRFHIGTISDEQVAWLRHALCGGSPFLPEPEWYRDGVHWCCRYPYSASTTAEHITREEVMEFLLFCLRTNIVCASVKRANFRRREGGGILWVDIGCDIMPMNVDYFIDSAARLYAIAILGWADEELRRRERGPKTEDTFAAIPGFAGFYLELLTEHASRFWATAPKVSLPAPCAPASNVTLLIKACAMDAAALFEQARAIVTQLQVPRPFHERILAIDPSQGPFLRQYTSGDYALLLQEADRLREAGLIDRVLIAPDSPEAVAAINERWFGVACEKSHSCKGVPVAPQLWAFDQVTTKYVLQCDADVLIGRTDLNHDYLAEMLAAAEADGVMGVAFNIPHGPGALSRPYAAPAGEYVPEVRCGLLDLIRVRRCCPLPNMVTGGALVLSWYRSLQQHQNAHGLRTLRGGDPRTYYVHPPNEWKIDQQALARARDLIGQGRIPPIQQDQWDLLGSAADWQYERRTEDIVFLLKGRNTPIHRVQRCVASLVMQDVQEFGAVVIDDASDGELPYLLPHLLAPIAARTTLVRRDVPHGRMPNFITAISEICTNPETLIVILDIDDALLAPTVVRRLKGFYDEGADVVLGSMFRPDKPIKLYHPQFTNVRPAWGGEVWIHLRSFRKKLFDALPHSYLQIDGEWIAQCTDYATMIPMVEMCQSPRYIPEYLYFHERTTPRTAELRRIKDGIIRRILGKEPLTAVPALV